MSFGSRRRNGLKVLKCQRSASYFVGDRWEMHDEGPVDGRPPDTWITFRS